jgi:hypothetical protein
MTEFIVTPVTRSTHLDIDEADTEREFRAVSATDDRSWFTVLVRDTGKSLRFSVWRGSRFAGASVRRKAQLPTHAVSRVAVVESVKAHLNAQ